MRTPLWMALILCIVSFNTALASDEIPGEWRPTGILILKSTPKYDEALKTAKEAASALHLKLDLEGYEPNAESGLSLSEMGCGEAAFDFPCYVPRGRGRRDDLQTYVSIEYSSGFEGFAEKLYIVVANDSSPGNKQAARLLKEVRAKFPDAYIKRTRTYVGCLH